MNGSDPSVPWLVAAYAVTAVLIGGYLLRLLIAKQRLKNRDNRAK